MDIEDSHYFLITFGIVIPSLSANVARPTLAYFMNRLVEEHAKINFNILPQPQGTKLTEKELYLIVRNYDYYGNFSEYFNDLMGVVLFP
uniref:Uncharacterized protein n=1 Tax=Acrobeloides nanus TaxID=290746 RepID=A0A914D7J6_9BILA